MYDVIIIGGGCIGTSIARELSKYNIELLLLEKNIEICQESTKANSAVIHGGYDAEPGTLKAKLNVIGRDMFSDLSKELEFDYKNIGSMVLAFNKEDEVMLEELYNRGIKNKVKDLKILSGDMARNLEPLISDDVISVLHCRTSGVVDPFNYTYAMMENAIDNGVKLKTDTELLSLEKNEDYIIAKTNNGDYKSRFVINAAGLNSSKVASMAHDFDFKILPTIGVYRILRKDDDFSLNKILFQTPSLKGKGVLVTPTYDKNMMIGPTSNMIKKLSNTPSQEESLKILDKLAKKSVGKLDLNKSIRVFTGIRAKSDTRDFMIYPSENMKGVIHVGGIASPGLSSAPAIGNYVRDILENIGLELKYKENFNSKRIRIPRLSKLEDSKREKLIEENSKFGNRICICESVSEGEIVEAINRGAVTSDGVKRRTRAGMGHCQGNRCKSKVRTILARELHIDESEIKEEVHGIELVEKYLNREK